MSGSRNNSKIRIFITAGCLIFVGMSIILMQRMNELMPIDNEAPDMPLETDDSISSFFKNVTTTTIKPITTSTTPCYVFMIEPSYPKTYYNNWDALFASLTISNWNPIECLNRNTIIFIPTSRRNEFQFFINILKILFYEVHPYTYLLKHKIKNSTHIVTNLLHNMMLSYNQRSIEKNISMNITINFPNWLSRFHQVISSHKLDNISYLSSNFGQFGTQLFNINESINSMSAN